MTDLSRLRRLWLPAMLVVALLAGIAADRLVLLRPLSLATFAPRRVAKGVTLLGRDVGGFDLAQVSTLLGEIAPSLKRDPVDARIDPDTKGLIPELYGRELDVESTVATLLTAQPNAVVSPAFRPVKPKKSMRDLPATVIYRGNPAKKQIALCINVAWGDEFIAPMLESLAQANAKATFFFVGTWANKNRSVVQQIAAAGHEVASHGYSHIHLSQAATETVRKDTAANSSLLEEITRQPIRIFSPAYGEWDARTPVIASDLGLTTVLWSIDTVDWKKPGVEAMTNKILTRAHNGAIVLMHPTDQTKLALPKMIAGLQGKGYSLVTVSELLSPVDPAFPLTGGTP